jgi:hypothetical protein
MIINGGASMADDKDDLDDIAEAISKGSGPKYKGHVEGAYEPKYENARKPMPGGSFGTGWADAKEEQKNEEPPTKEEADQFKVINEFHNPPQGNEEPQFIYGSGRYTAPPKGAPKIETVYGMGEAGGSIPYGPEYVKQHAVNEAAFAPVRAQRTETNLATKKKLIQMGGEHETVLEKLEQTKEQAIAKGKGDVDIEEEVRGYRESKLPKRGITDTIVSAKGYWSEKKLKTEASKYGVTEKDFEQAKKEGKLSSVKLLVDQGKDREQERKNAKAREEKASAEAQHERMKAYGSQVKAEQADPTVPKGGLRLVQFGTKEGSFGQEPIYVNAAGSHGSIRERFLPGAQTGVATAMARSRLAMAEMKGRVVPRSEGKVAVLLPGGIELGATESDQRSAVLALGVNPYDRRSTIMALGVNPRDKRYTTSMLGVTPYDRRSVISGLAANQYDRGYAVSNLGATQRIYQMDKPYVTSRLAVTPYDRSVNQRLGVSYYPKYQGSALAVTSYDRSVNQRLGIAPGNSILEKLSWRRRQ